MYNIEVEEPKTGRWLDLSKILPVGGAHASAEEAFFHAESLAGKIPGVAALRVVDATSGVMIWETRQEPDGVVTSAPACTNGAPATMPAPPPRVTALPTPAHLSSAARALVLQIVASIDESLVGFEAVIEDAKHLGLPGRFVSHLETGRTAAFEQREALNHLLKGGGA